MNTDQFHLWRYLHKRVKFQIVFQSNQNGTWKINIYGLCKYRANNIEIKRTGDGSRDGVDPHHLRSNIYGTGTRDGVDPQKLQHILWIQRGGWTPHHLRWDIYMTGVRDGVDPQKVQHKYRSRDGSWDGVDNS